MVQKSGNKPQANPGCIPSFSNGDHFLDSSVRKDLNVTWIPCYHVFVIQSFKDLGTEDIFNGKNTKRARAKCPNNLWRVAARKLDQLDSVQILSELRIPPGNKLEELTKNRLGQHSIRINDQDRICFAWSEAGPEQVEIVDDH